MSDKRINPYKAAVEQSQSVLARFLEPGGDVVSEASALTLLLTILDDERFIAACREYDTGSAWRPIDEAPTDGTPVLITGFRRGKPWLERFVHEASYQGGRWRDATGFSLYPPTHFMPLPDPPVDVRPEDLEDSGRGGEVAL